MRRSPRTRYLAVAALVAAVAVVGILAGRGGDDGSTTATGVTTAVPATAITPPTTSPPTTSLPTTSTAPVDTTAAPTTVAPETTGTQAVLPAGLALTQSCANVNDGFSLRYPEGWSTESENVNWACSLFDPAPFVLTPDSEVPPTAVIAYVVNGSFAETYKGLGDPDMASVISNEGRTVAGRPAAALEVQQTLEIGYLPAGTYRYYVLVDRYTRTFVLETNSSVDGYETNKDVVDAMIQTLQLAPSTS